MEGGEGGARGGGGAVGAKSPVIAGSSMRSTTVYSSGGGKFTTIPAGQPIAGCSSGGGTRTEVFGNQYVEYDIQQHPRLIFGHRQYGSGCPGVTGRGVIGCRFPFMFWPVVWGGAIGLGAGAYPHSDEVIDFTTILLKPL